MEVRVLKKTLLQRAVEPPRLTRLYVLLACRAAQEGPVGRVSGGCWGEKVEGEGEYPSHGVLLVPFAF